MFWGVIVQRRKKQGGGLGFEPPKIMSTSAQVLLSLMNVSLIISELDECAPCVHVNSDVSVLLVIFPRNDFANNLAETRQRYEIEINVLKEELANGYDAVMEGQRDNDHKQIEIESLKMILETTEQNFQTSRERMTELSEKYCRLIEQETENEVRWKTTTGYMDIAQVLNP